MGEEREMAPVLAAEGLRERWQDHSTVTKLEEVAAELGERVQEWLTVEMRPYGSRELGRFQLRGTDYVAVGSRTQGGVDGPWKWVGEAAMAVPGGGFLTTADIGADRMVVLRPASRRMRPEAKDAGEALAVGRLAVTEAMLRVASGPAVAPVLVVAPVGDASADHVNGLLLSVHGKDEGRPCAHVRAAEVRVREGDPRALGSVLPVPASAEEGARRVLEQAARDPCRVVGEWMRQVMEADGYEPAGGAASLLVRRSLRFPPVGSASVASEEAGPCPWVVPRFAVQGMVRQRAGDSAEWSWPEVEAQAKVAVGPRASVQVKQWAASATLMHVSLVSSYLAGTRLPCPVAAPLWGSPPPPWWPHALARALVAGGANLAASMQRRCHQSASPLAGWTLATWSAGTVRGGLDTAVDNGVVSVGWRHPLLLPSCVGATHPVVMYPGTPTPTDPRWTLAWGATEFGTSQWSLPSPSAAAFPPPLWGVRRDPPGSVAGEPILPPPTPEDGHEAELAELVSRLVSETREDRREHCQAWARAMTLLQHPSSSPTSSDHHAATDPIGWLSAPSTTATLSSSLALWTLLWTEVCRTGIDRMSAYEAAEDAIRADAGLWRPGTPPDRLSHAGLARRRRLNATNAFLSSPPPAPTAAHRASDDHLRHSADAFGAAFPSSFSETFSAHWEWLLPNPAIRVALRHSQTPHTDLDQPLTPPLSSLLSSLLSSSPSPTSSRSPSPSTTPPPSPPLSAAAAAEDGPVDAAGVDLSFSAMEGGLDDSRARDGGWADDDTHLRTLASRIARGADILPPPAVLRSLLASTFQPGQQAATLFASLAPLACNGPRSASVAWSGVVEHVEWHWRTLTPLPGIPLPPPPTHGWDTAPLELNPADPPIVHDLQVIQSAILHLRAIRTLASRPSSPPPPPPPPPRSPPSGSPAPSSPTPAASFEALFSADELADLEATEAPPPPPTPPTPPTKQPETRAEEAGEGAASPEERGPSPEGPLSPVDASIVADVRELAEGAGAWGGMLDAWDAELSMAMGPSEGTWPDWDGSEWEMPDDDHDDGNTGRDADDSAVFRHVLGELQSPVRSSPLRRPGARRAALIVPPMPPPQGPLPHGRLMERAREAVHAGKAPFGSDAWVRAVVLRGGHILPSMRAFRASNGGASFASFLTLFPEALFGGCGGGGRESIFAQTLLRLPAAARDLLDDGSVQCAGAGGADEEDGSGSHWSEGEAQTWLEAWWVAGKFQCSAQHQARVLWSAFSLTPSSTEPDAHGVVLPGTTLPWEEAEAALSRLRHVPLGTLFPQLWALCTRPVTSLLASLDPQTGREGPDWPLRGVAEGAQAAVARAEALVHEEAVQRSTLPTVGALRGSSDRADALADWAELEEIQDASRWEGQRMRVSATLAVAAWERAVARQHSLIHLFGGATHIPIDLAHPAAAFQSATGSGSGSGRIGAWTVPSSPRGLRMGEPDPPIDFQSPGPYPLPASAEDISHGPGWSLARPLVSAARLTPSTRSALTSACSAARDTAPDAPAEISMLASIAARPQPEACLPRTPATIRLALRVTPDAVRLASLAGPETEGNKDEAGEIGD